MAAGREGKFNENKSILYSLFSFFFSLAVLFSIKMPTDFKKIFWTGISLADLFLFGIIFFIVLLTVIFLNRGIDWINSRHKNEKSVTKIPTGCIFIIIFLAWMPFFLAFYPGNISGDSFSSIYQALSHITSTAHPVLFTLLVKVTLKTGLFLFHNMNAAIAVFSITQMLLLDGILTYTVFWLNRHGISRKGCILAVIYFALNPLIVRFSFTMWKDILFSGVMLLLVLFLYDVAIGAKRLTENRDLLQFLALAVLVSFLRNRIVYAVIAIFILLIGIYRTYWKKMLVVFLLTSVLIFFIQGPLYSYLNIRPSNFAEGQGVSLQQIAAVVVDDGKISESEKEFINKIIPLEDIPKAYNPSTVDNLKGYETFDHNFLNSHSVEYVKIWISILFKNPWYCTKAWLMTTRSFWGFNVFIEPFAITWPSEKLNIHQVNIVEKITGIDLAYISNAILVHIEDIPIIRRFFESGCLGWFGIFVAMRMASKKCYRILLALLPLNLLWIVLIVTTPIFFEARYMFVYNLALPVLIWILFSGEKTENLI